MYYFRHTALAATLLLSFSSLPLLAADKPASSAYFEAEDIFALEYAKEPQVSPDGKQLVYVRNSNDIMTDGTHSSLWLLDVKTGHQSPLFVDQFNYGSPRWSEDGSRIAFISDRSGSRQIHVHYVKENKTALVSQLSKSPGNLNWSPDGEQLAFTMNVPAQPTKLAKATKMPKKPEGAKWSEPAVLIERAQYQADGQGFLKSEYRHLFLLSSDGGSARQLTSGDRSYGEDLTFSPDGKALVFSANLAPDWEYQPRDSDLYQLDLRSGQLKQLTAVPGQETSPVFSPDGKKLAYLWGSNAKLPFANGKLKVLDVASGKSRDIGASLELDLTAPDWWSNDELTVQYDEKGLRKVALLERSAFGAMISEIMTADVITVGLRDTSQHCMQLMTDRHLRHLPVLAEGELIGLLSIGDLVKHTIAEQASLILQLEQYIRGE